RDDKQAGNLREIRGKVFGDAVAKILLLRVLAHVGEGQHDKGGFVGQGQRMRLRLLSNKCRGLRTDWWARKIPHGQEGSCNEQQASHSRHHPVTVGSAPYAPRYRFSGSETNSYAAWRKGASGVDWSQRATAGGKICNLR